MASYRYFLFLAFFCLCEILSAQNVTVESRVVDSKGDPLAFVHVYHEKTRSGTISNLKGFFLLNIPTSDLKSEVKISSIGFDTRVFTIEQLVRQNSIALRESLHELQAVTITPRNYALELMEKVIERIPYNYPDQREMNAGFTREKVYWENRKDDPIYIAEATIESLKESYEKKGNKNGHIKIIKGRKHESVQLDSLTIRFYGGLFDAFRGDEVYVRSTVFNPRNHNNYDFSISDTLLLEGKPLFVLDFAPRKKTVPRGSLYVLDSSYAVVKSTYFYDKDAAADFLEGIGGYKRLLITEETEYYNAEDGRWRMKLYRYQTAFETPKDRNLHVESQYLTTHVSDTFSEIPYLERSQYQDIFLNKTGIYDSDFWEKYNVLLADSVTENLFKQGAEEPPPKRKKLTVTKIIEILKRIRGSYGIMYQPNQLEARSIAFSNSEFTIDHSQREGTDPSIGLYSSILYEFKPNFYLGYETSISFGKNEFRTIDIMIQGDLNLNPNGRPLLLSPALNVGWQKLGYRLGSFTSANSFELEGRTFDSGQTDVSVLSVGHNINPRIYLSIEKSRTLHFFVQGGYNFFFEKKSGLLFEETNQFFLKRKKRFVENGSENVLISGSSILSNNWNVTVGFTLGLDL